MIIFIRHGMTKYNKQNRCQGLLNTPLCREGIKQAKLASQQLKNLSIDIIFSSPLKRAYKTAKIINKYHKVKINKVDSLKEYDVGKYFQGLKINNFSKQLLMCFREDPTLYKGQDIGEFHNKIVKFYESIKDLDKNILIVSHGGVYGEIVSHITHKEEFGKIKNCEIKVIKE